MSAPPWYAAPRCRFAQRLTAQRELHGQGDARDPDSSPLPPNARATARGHATPFGHGGAGTECGMGETSAEPATDSDGAMRPAISSNASNLQEGCRGDRSWARTTKEAPHYDNTTGLSRSGDRVPSAVRRRQWRRISERRCARSRQMAGGIGWTAQRKNTDGLNGDGRNVPTKLAATAAGSNRRRHGRRAPPRAPRRRGRRPWSGC